MLIEQKIIFIIRFFSVFDRIFDLDQTKMKLKIVKADWNVYYQKKIHRIELMNEIMEKKKYFRPYLLHESSPKVIFSHYFHDFLSS